MAKTDNLKDFLTDVADAIREKKGTTDLINPQDFSAEIASIKSGGGGVDAASPKAVNFRDYDGTILHSYTKDEFLALTELPPLPTREGLICQEWNWDFTDAVEYVTEYGVLEVGATYITDDGKTRLYIEVSEGLTTFQLNVKLNTEALVDWGDNSEPELARTSIIHNYPSEGKYCISISPTENSDLHFSSSGTKNICGSTSAGSSNPGYVNGSQIVRVELGERITLSEGLFIECASLVSISIPKGVTSVGNKAFYKCVSLKSLILPKAVNSIGTSICYYNMNLQAISFPNGITSIGTGAFEECRTLKRAIIPTSLTLLSAQIFNNCLLSQTIIIPDNITELGNYALSGNRGLTKLFFPSSVMKLGYPSFQGCASMRIYDFSTHTEVVTLTYRADQVFYGINPSAKIIVPDTLYDAWVADSYWNYVKGTIIKKSDWDASQSQVAKQDA